MATFRVTTDQGTYDVETDDGSGSSLSTATTGSNIAKSPDYTPLIAGAVGAAGVGGIGAAAMPIINFNRAMSPKDAALNKMTADRFGNGLSSDDLPEMLTNKYKLDVASIARPTEQQILQGMSPQLKPIDTALADIAKTNLPGVQARPEDLPSLLSKKNAVDVSRIKVPDTTSFSKDIKMQRNLVQTEKANFDTQVVNKRADELARHIAENSDESVNSGYNKYKADLQEISDLVDQKTPIKTSTVADRLLNSTIDESAAKGVTPDKLSSLASLAKEYAENPAEISFSQVKGNVTALLNDKTVPVAAKHVLTDQWQKFLGEYTPPEAMPKFQAMQARYAEFAPFRNALFSYYDPAKGVFNTSVLSAKLRNLAKNNIDAGVGETLDVLSNGRGHIAPTAGVADKVESLMDASAKRGEFKAHLSTLDAAEVSHAQDVARAQAQIDALKGQHAELSSKTSELLSQRKAIVDPALQKAADAQAATKQALDLKYAQDTGDVSKILSEKNALAQKYPIRAMISGMNPVQIAKTAGKIAKMVGGGLLHGVATGVVENELMKRSVGYDPMDAINAVVTGAIGSPEEKKNLEAELLKRIQEANAL